MEPDRKPLQGHDDNKVLIGDVRNGSLCMCACVPLCARVFDGNEAAGGDEGVKIKRERRRGE